MAANNLEVMDAVVREVVSQLETMEVAKVISFDKDTCTAVVQLLIKYVSPRGYVEPTPLTLYDVPVRFPQMGDLVIYSPPNVGDTGFVHFSKSDWENWFYNSSPNSASNQSGTLLHSTSSCYFECGAANYKNPKADTRFKDHMHLVYKEDQYITMSESEVVITKGNTKITLNDSGIIMDGNLTVNGTITDQNTNLTTHTHQYTDADTSSGGNGGVKTTQTPD